MTDLHAVEARLIERGLPVHHVRTSHADRAVDVLHTTDFDGTPIEISPASSGPRYQTIHLLCRDLDASIAFYGEVLHLDHDDPAGYHLESGGALLEAGRRARAYLPGQRDKFWLTLTQPDEPFAWAPNDRSGNTAGLYRMALLVDDVAAAHADFAALTPSAPEPLEVYVGEAYEPVPALFFRDPDGAVVEYLEGVFV
jgi:catechol 2,3-dioxygenase-like lactoylglutathione lyase family enzyme